MKLSRFIFAGIALAASVTLACSQTSPGLYNGQVPTAAQWNSYFAGKQDYPVPAFTSGASGSVPASGGGTTNFLRADGTWAAPAGGGGGTPANPTATIGAAAVNGSASTYMRSDAAPALPGTLPALNGSLLTNLTAANLTGALPAISGASLTSLTAANLTGALPAISGASLTSLTAANLSGAVPVNKGGTNCTAAALACLTAITGATGTPSGTTFLRGDNTWATPAGSGNVSGPGSAVSGNIASYNGTSGTIIQDGGIATSAITTLTGSQTLTNKTLTAPIMTAPVLGTPASGTLTNTTGLVPSTGLAATGTPSSSTFLRGDNSWQTVTGTGTVTTLTAGTGITLSSGATCTTTCTISLATALRANTATTDTILAADGGKVYSTSNASAQAITLPTVGTTGFGSGFGFNPDAIGAGTATITSASNIDGLGSIALTTGQGASIYSDGTTYHAIMGVPQIANSRFFGNNSGATSYGNAMTGTQATALLDTFTSSLKGLAPSSGGGTTNFLRADGTWTAPPGGGGGGGGTFNYSSGSNTITASTYFAPIGGGGTPVTTEAAVQVNSPAATTVANLKVTLSVDPGNTNTVVITARLAGADQTLTCTITGNGTTNKTCSDTTHSFNPVAGDLLDWKVVNSASFTGTINISASNGTSNVGVTTLTAGTNVTFSSGSTCTTACTINATGGGGTTYTSTFSGNVSGTPGATGLGLVLATATFTDNATAGSGTAALFAAHSIAAPTLAATNTSVTTTHAASLYIAGAPIAGTNETLTATSAVYLANGNLNFGTNTQKIQMFNVGTPGCTNCEIGQIGWVSNVFTIGAVANGTGSNRVVRLNSQDSIDLNFQNALTFTRGATLMTMNSNYLFSNISNGLLIQHGTVASHTNPVFIPFGGSTNTGVGGTTAPDLSLITNGVERVRIDNNGMNMQSGVFTLKGFTVATLPASPATGSLAFVSDANAACTYNTAPAGGGSTPCKVWYNGTAWVEG